MASGIYSITCTNGHRYIGSAVNLRDRWRQHRRALRLGSHKNAHLQNAWDKYGEDAFAFELLEEWDPEFLVSMEQLWINCCAPEYNICQVASSQLGVKRSQDTRARCRAANLGRKYGEETCAKHRAYRHTPEDRAKQSAAQMGHIVRPDVAIKIGLGMVGNKNGLGHHSCGRDAGWRHTAETKAKISESQKRRFAERRGEA